jgi:hypothetical protein
MTLTKDFHFSSQSLQDYVDCPRRFELRYLLCLNWPALETEPAIEQEHRQELGQRFHEIIHQVCLGLPEEAVLSQITDMELQGWWNNFSRSSLLANISGQKMAEFSLTASFANYRLVAKYDLLVIDYGQKITIFDWKTTSKTPLRAVLADRLQTRVYPFLVAEVGRAINKNQPIEASQVEMIYWFPAEPNKAVRFTYDQEQYLADKAFLSGLIREIEALAPGHFLMTQDEKKCLYCRFRSFCNRGGRAGSWNETVQDEFSPEKLDFEFEQIGEIEF